MALGYQFTVSQALAAVERDHFISSQDLAHVVTGHSMPSCKIIKTLLLMAPPIRPDDVLMHIGAGSGYLSAILSHLGSFVYAIERNKAVADLARKRLSNKQIESVQVIAKDALELTPFDPPPTYILCTCVLPDASRLATLLADDGDLVCLSGDSAHPELHHYHKSENELSFQGSLGTLDFHDARDTLINITPVIKSSPARAEPEVIDQGATQTLNELFDILQPELFGFYSRTYLEAHRILPICETDDDITLVTDDKKVDQDELRNMHPSKRIVCRIITADEFKRLWSHLDVVSRGKEMLNKQLAEPMNEGKTEDEFNPVESQINPYLVSVYEGILIEAVSSSASDIHLELYGDKVRIRIRVDGDLHDFNKFKLTAKELRGLVNVIKIRSELNIAERRLPQGGRSQLRYGKDSYDLRIQTQPSLHGEHIVIRVLKHTGRAMTMEELGMSGKIAGYYQRLLINPAGLVLVVGPTGSGKSTTLYAGLQELADDGSRKVLTAEDPIEYSIDKVQQSHVRPDIGFTFADALRAFVREDPDVILVGEIRDHETALEAVRASQTGHLVLSTLHCNDAVDSLQRLYDLQIHPNSLASELLAVIAQRLAKRICPHCSEEDSPPEDLLNEVFPDGVPANFRSYRGRGCDKCEGRGTKGRIAVIEYMYVNGDIRSAIAQKPNIEEMRWQALDSGLLTMRDSALAHVIEGRIALSELRKILPQERMAPEKRGVRGRK